MTVRRIVWAVALLLTAGQSIWAATTIAPTKWCITGEEDMGGAVTFREDQIRTLVGGNGSDDVYHAMLLFDLNTFTPSGSDAYLNLWVYDILGDESGGDNINVYLWDDADYEAAPYSSALGTIASDAHFAGVDAYPGSLAATVQFPGENQGVSINVQSLLDSFTGRWLGITMKPDASWAADKQTYWFADPQDVTSPPEIESLTMYLASFDPYAGHQITLGEQGQFVIPEPATMALLALGGLAYLRPSRCCGRASRAG